MLYFTPHKQNQNKPLLIMKINMPHNHKKNLPIFTEAYKKIIANWVILKTNKMFINKKRNRN